MEALGCAFFPLGGTGARVVGDSPVWSAFGCWNSFSTVFVGRRGVFSGDVQSLCGVFLLEGDGACVDRDSLVRRSGFGFQVLSEVALCVPSRGSSLEFVIGVSMSRMAGFSHHGGFVCQ